jgi:hypothetical protein
MRRKKITNKKAPNQACKNLSSCGLEYRKGPKYKDTKEQREK